ncbi:MAG: AlpA family phage regulatory protein [Lysobacterales bacterium]
MSFQEQRVAPRLLRRDAVSALTGIPRSSLYARIRAGDFPAPVRLGPRCVAWDAAQVDLWIDAKLGNAAQGGAP